MTIKLKESIKLASGDVLSAGRIFEVEKKGKYYFIKVKSGLTAVVHQRLVIPVE